MNQKKKAFEWTPSFDTHIESVDQQHKKLFQLLKALFLRYERNEVDIDFLRKAVTELQEYAHRHFADEEALMQKAHLSARHLSAHLSEHTSFTRDTAKLGARLSSGAPLSDAEQRTLVERLVAYITAWLTWHILGMDHMMASQMEAIAAGASAEDAYEAHRENEYDAETTRLLLGAVMHLWRVATDRCRELEQVLGYIDEAVQ